MQDYKTLYPWFMESVWWAWSQLFAKGLVYHGYKVMPFSTAWNTPLSNFEVNMNYVDVTDPAVIVNFPIDQVSIMHVPKLLHVQSFIVTVYGLQL